MHGDATPFLQGVIDSQPPEVRERVDWRAADRYDSEVRAARRIRNLSGWIRESTAPGSEERGLCEMRLRQMQADAPNGMER